MRYLVQFVDKTSMIISKEEGDQVGKALTAGEAVVLHGAYFSPRFISAVKPINKNFFDNDFVEQQERLELESPNTIRFLTAPND